MEAKYVRVLKEEVLDNIEEANLNIRKAEMRIEYWKGRKAVFEQLLKDGGKEKK
ncbi:hypothetical protein KAT51_08130 [bacterium]|nr:hypothetical protein [bacterium]